MARKPHEIVTTSIRFPERLRKKLEVAAKTTHNSFNGEVISRLEGSFDEESQALKFQTAIEMLAGNPDNAQLMAMISSALQYTTMYGDKDPSSSDNMEVFHTAITAIIAAHAGRSYKMFTVDEVSDWPPKKRMGYIIANVILQSRDFPPLMETLEPSRPTGLLSHLFRQQQAAEGK